MIGDGRLMEKVQGKIASEAVDITAYLHAQAIAAGVRRPESPIEEAMFRAFCWAALIERRLCLVASDGHDFWRSPVSADVEMRVHPQWEFENFRADFAVHVTGKGVDRWIAIECDGHEFHERTPDQAERDKRRDRAFARGGVTVLRFAGREVYRDAVACVNEVRRLAGSMALQDG